MTHEELFAQPAHQGMLNLSDEDFNGFVRYVFTRAGYDIEPDADGTHWCINENGKHIGYLAVNHNGVNPVQVQSVAALNGLIGAQKKIGYFVTTSDFVPQAYAKAADWHHIFLINKDHFRRYIDYIRGTRFENSSAPAIPATLLLEADETMKSIAPTKTRVLMVANNRGGIGKTVTALNLAYGLAQKGKQVLAIDMDAQANLTQYLLRSGTPVPLHLGHYFAKQKKLGDLMRATQFENISVLPADPEMRLLYADMSEWPHLQIKFAQDLLSPDITNHPSIPYGGLDWIVIDTPPDMGLLTRAAMSAAHYVLAPTVVSGAGNLGIRNMLDTTSAMRALMGGADHAHFIGLVAARWEGKQAMKQDFAALKAFLKSTGASFMETNIPEDAKVDKATKEAMKSGNHHAIDLFSKEGPKVSSAYANLIQEVLAHVGNA